MAVIQKNIRGAGFLPGIPLLAGCLACFAFFMPGTSSFLQYDRDRIESGEIWRLLTSHWTHWSVEHLLWDAAMFMVLLFVYIRRNPKRVGIMLGTSSIAIPLGIYLLQPGLIYYRGLSGLDAALFACIAVQMAKNVMERGTPSKKVLVSLLLLGLGLKIAFEAVTGQAVFVAHMAPNIVVIPLAHIIGAGIGFITGLRFIR